MSTTPLQRPVTELQPNGPVFTTSGVEFLLDTKDAYLNEVAAAAGLQVVRSTYTKTAYFAKVRDEKPRHFRPWSTFVYTVDLFEIDTVVGTYEGREGVIIATVGAKSKLNAKVRQDRTVVNYR